MAECLFVQVLGATDPTSGTVSTAETIKGLGALLKKGWKPLRTIVIASWDAEEVPSSISFIEHVSSFCVVWSHWKHRMGGRLPW